jgi:hypothetical protein
MLGAHKASHVASCAGEKVDRVTPLQRLKLCHVRLASPQLLVGDGEEHQAGAGVLLHT